MIYRLDFYSVHQENLGLFKLHFTIPYYLAAVLSILGIVFTVLRPYATNEQPLDRKYIEDSLDLNKDQARLEAFRYCSNSNDLF